MVTAEAFAEYRTSVSKYCYAVSYMLDRMETPETLRVRWQAHILGTRLALLRIFKLYNDAHMGPEVGTWFPDAIVLDSMHKEREAVEATAVTATTVTSTTSAARQRRSALTAPTLHDSYIIDDIMVEINSAAQRGFTEESVGRGSERAEEPLRVLYEELPEVLKLSAELSFELLQVLLGHREPARQRGASVASSAGGTSVTEEGGGGGNAVDVVLSGSEGSANTEVHTVRSTVGMGSLGVDAHWWVDQAVLCEVLGSVEFTLRVLRSVVHSSQVGIIESMQRDVVGARDQVGECE